MSKIHPAIQYADDILNEKIVAGKWVKLACERYFNDVKNASNKGFYHDEKKAQLIIDFFEKCLKHWKGKWAGKPIVLEPNQQFVLWNKWGWYWEQTRLRRFNRSLKSVARKNGKTTELAGEALYHLTLDGENGPQVFIGASKEDQARILLKDCKGFIQFESVLPPLESYAKSIYNPANMGFIQPLGKDSKRQDGLHPSLGCIDEAHALEDWGVPNVIQGGMKGRENPMLSFISTRGFNLNGPYFKFEGVVEDILKGVKVDERLFGIIYTLDDEDDWRDDTTWIKSNPNLGVSVMKSDVRVAEAILEGGEKEVEVKTKDLNLWVGSSNSWISDHIWNRNVGDEIALDGQQAWGGLDLASSQDTNSFSLIIPNEDKFDLKLWCWMPRDTAMGRKDKEQFLAWEADGWITLTPGDVMDHRYIINQILDIIPHINLQMIGYDRRYASSGVIQELFSEQELPMEEIAQSYTALHPATVEFKDLALKNKFNHEDNPVLRWMLNNVTITYNADNLIKVNRADSRDKIDGVVSSIMGLKSFLDKDEIDYGKSEVW